MSVKPQGPAGGVQVLTLRGVPIFVNMWFAVLAFLCFLSFQQVTPFGPLGGLAVVFAMVLAVIVHEMGHALVARRFGLEPRILLHGFGGLCIHKEAPTPRHNAWVTAAGPLAGFAAAAVVFVVVLPTLSALSPSLLVVMDASGAVTGETVLGVFLAVFCYFNVAWSIFNLVPIWPMDGGILFALLIRRYRKGAEADQLIHGVGVGLAGLMLMWALSGGHIFLAFIVGTMGWDNLKRLQGRKPASRSGSRRPFAMPKGGAKSRPAIPGSTVGVEFVRLARAAMATGRWREAARLMHQMREQADLGPELSDQSYEILGLAYTELRDYEEAMDYLARAPISPATEAARKRCLSEQGTDS